MAARVGYVLKRFPRLSQTFVLRELLAHQRAGLNMTVFSYRKPRVEDHHADYIALDAELVVLDDQAAGDDASGRHQQACERLIRACRERQIDQLHAHFAGAAATLAGAAAAELAIPFSVTTHARDLFHQDVTATQLRERLQGASAVVTISDFNRRFLASDVGLDPRRLHLIYNGLPLESFPFTADQQREPILLAVGRLIEKKGFDDLLTAAAWLQGQQVAFEVVIIGSGPQTAALQQRADQLGIAEKVRLLGALPPAQVMEWMRRAALLVAPCRVGDDGDRDGLPTVILEAMALGTPCVATPVTGIPEAISGDGDGWLVPERDPEALAAACASALDDAAERRRRAWRARQTIEQRFDIVRSSAQLRALWNRPQP